MQVCTSLQAGNHASTPPLSFLQAGCPSCRPTNSVKALNVQSATRHLVVLLRIKRLLLYRERRRRRRGSAATGRRCCWHDTSMCRRRTGALTGSSAILHIAQPLVLKLHNVNCKLVFFIVQTISFIYTCIVISSAVCQMS